MANKYAGSDLYPNPIGLRQPLERDKLYHLYGITNYATTAFNTWYRLSPTDWLTPITYFGLYDSVTNKYFIKNHFVTNELTSCWLTIHELLHSWSNSTTHYIAVSPTNELSSRPIYSLVTGEEVIAIQYSDPVSGQTLYYIHPNYIQEANLGWHTPAELLPLGYSFEPRSLSCVYNIGSSTTSRTSIGVVQY